MDNSYATIYPDLYRKHWWWRVREDILLRTIAALVDDRGRPRILDVGCGAGLFFGALQHLGHVEGIESDSVALENSGTWRRHIHHGELDDTFLPAEPYDIILMLDVLEHLDDPDAILRRAGALLRPGGRLVITVPAFNWLWTSHDELNHHRRRYTLRTLSRSLVAADLSVVKSTYLFQSLVLPKAIVRLKEALLSAPPRVPAVPRPLLNKTLQTWFRSEYAVARALPFGTSLMVVARSRHDGSEGRDDRVTRRPDH